MVQPFRAQEYGRPRFEFRDWVQQNFPYFSDATGSRSDANRAHAVEHRAVLLQAARETLAWTEEHSGSEIRKYYAEDVARIRAANEGGSDDGFLDAIDHLLGGIEWE